MSVLAEAEGFGKSLDRRSDDHVLVLCHMLSNRISDVFEGEFSHDEVSVPEWRVLLSLAGGHGLNAQTIAARWAMNKMMVSRAIDGLAYRNLIQKTRNQTDGRVHDLALTKSGRRLYDRLVPIANRRYRELTWGLSDRELNALKQTLSKLIARADEITK